MNARQQELLCDRALEGLDEELARELASYGEDDLSFDMTAAAIEVAMLRGIEPMPASLRAKVEAQALPRASNVVAMQPRSRSTAWVGWAFAAVFATLAVISFVRQPKEKEKDTPIAKVKTPSELRAELIAHGAKPIPWTATKDPGAAGASGDVVWDASQQRGFMRFAGLAKNDPQKIQYQLWIFDAERDERYPVDGGVFDIDAATGDVIVPITPKVKVNTAKLFAITIEPPGGVVVSKRERIVLTAAL